MEKFKLTIEKLNDALPRTMLATGTALDNHQGINITNSNKELRWVLRRGQINDWCIYCHWSNHDEGYITMHGDKVINKHNIKNIIDIDDEEVWNLMRY